MSQPSLLPAIPGAYLVVAVVVCLQLRSRLPKSRLVTEACVILGLVWPVTVLVIVAKLTGWVLDEMARHQRGQQ